MTAAWPGQGCSTPATQKTSRTAQRLLSETHALFFLVKTNESKKDKESSCFKKKITKKVVVYKKQMTKKVSCLKKMTKKVVV